MSKQDGSFPSRIVSSEDVAYLMLQRHIDDYGFMGRLESTSKEIDIIKENSLQKKNVKLFYIHNDDVGKYLDEIGRGPESLELAFLKSNRGKTSDDFRRELRRIFEIY